MMFLHKIKIFVVFGDSTIDKLPAKIAPDERFALQRFKNPIWIAVHREQTFFNAFPL